MLARPFSQTLDDAGERRRGFQLEEARDVEASLGNEIGRQGNPPQPRLHR